MHQASVIQPRQHPFRGRDRVGNLVQFRARGPPRSGVQFPVSDGLQRQDSGVNQQLVLGIQAVPLVGSNGNHEEDFADSLPVGTGDVAVLHP